MKVNLYAVHDEKVQGFTAMHFCQTHAESLRGFSDAIRDSKTVFSKHPEDYALYNLGSMDVETGYVEAVVPIVFLARGSEFSNTVITPPTPVTQGV